MNREYLFRGKTKRNEWIYGDLITHGIDFDDAIKQHHTREVWDIIPETVGQYVGLKDKNGKKVFEGDYLIIAYQGIYLNEGVVEYNDKDYCWCLRKPNGLLVRLNEHGTDFFQVIGNIHDNKELLGE